MPASAINADSKTIPPGFAVVVSGDFCRIAVAPVLANALATDGAVKGGVVTLMSSGVLELTDWNAATGAKALTVGQTYYAQNGRLTTNSSGNQAIGQAISPTQLSIAIATSFSPAFTVVAPVTPAVVLPPKLWPTTTPPDIYMGKVGDFAVHIGVAFYGPKQPEGWGDPMPFVS